MTPRLRHLPHASLQRPLPSGGAFKADVAPAAGIARVPRFAVARAATPPAPVVTPSAPPAGGHGMLRDILSGLVDELAGENSGTKEPAASPVLATAEHLPTARTRMHAPWRRTPSPWVGSQP